MRLSGASTPSADMKVACSIPSIPAATASAIDRALCACAVTGRPRRCASATMARRTSTPNWGRYGSEPGVMFPPLAITLITSTPRSLRSRTAVLAAAAPSTSPPRKWQWPPGLVIGGPEARIVGIGSGPAAWSRRSSAADRVVAGVEAQVQVRVDQARHERSARQVDYLDPVCLAGGAQAPGGDRDDPAALDRHDRVGNQRGTDPVKQGAGPQDHLLAGRCPDATRHAPHSAHPPLGSHRGKP